MNAHATGLLVPLIYFAAAIVVKAGRFRTGRQSARLAGIAAALALVSAIATAGVLVLSGPGIAYSGIGAWVDPVSAAMILLVTFVGWIVLRFAATYLDGEQDESRFHFWMLATLAAVCALVVAPNLVQLSLSWIATSLFLHRLLLFYPHRPDAIRAARKKFIVARIGDGALVGAAVLLHVAYGSLELPTILENARGGPPAPGAVATVGLIAIAAILKSAQFPFHGWLTEVMETPTPVSALLHAGIVNAGGFLLIRFADILVGAPGILAALVVVGGFTAIAASVVMLTQPAVKASLAWSTIAQMGFMILQCGLALFPLALLHILAHSLYKAHAFLRAGSGIENVLADRRLGPVANPDFPAVLRAFGLALLIYAAIGSAFGIAGKPPQAIALGGILIFGVAYLIAQGLADLAPRALTVRTSAFATIASIAYFLLQRGAERLLIGTLPPPPVPGPLEWFLLTLAVTTFGAVALAQAMFPVWSRHPALIGVRVHLANGLYANALFDRLTGGWKLKARKSRGTEGLEA
ncbi:MAG: oxidoreductase [Alphaproteobacteria bacterium]|nr:oxidoreductase [Alphaproteobacteria bacterium]